MKQAARWLIALLAALLVVGLVAWARGEPHHHGIQVGSSAAYSSTLLAGG